MSKSKSIQFDSNHYGAFTFSDIDELENWINDERENQAWLGALPSGNNNAHYLKNHIEREFNSISQRIGVVKGDSENTHHINDLTNAITDLYDSNRILLSTDADYKYVEQVREEYDPTLAAHVYAKCINLTGGNINEPGFQEALFTYFAYKHGLSSNISAEKGALTKLKNKWQADLDLFKAKFIDVQKVGEDGNERALKKEGKRQAVFDEMISAKSKELDDVIDTYDKKLALQSSIGYWNKRAVEHNQKAEKYGRLSFWAGVAVMCFLTVIASVFFNKIQSPEYWQLITGAIFISFGVWLVRVLVKIYLSNTHLAKDSEERVTMLNTYLALLREGDIPDDENRKLILSTLFRPSHTGLIGEDGSLPTAFDFLSKYKG